MLGRVLIGALCVGALVASYFLVVDDLVQRWKVQSWQPVQASLISAELNSSRSSDTTTYKVTAIYRYQFGDKVYQNDKVTYSDAYDNLGDFHERQASRLKRALHEDKRVTVWVNPDNPNQSILVRELRWGLLAFKALFAGIFLCVSFGFLFLSGRDKIRKKRSPARAKQQAEKPWRKVKDWASPVVYSQAKLSMWVIWIIAIVWNSITAVPTTQIPRMLAKGDYGILFVLIFVAVGLGLIAAAIHKTLEWHRFGKTPLNLDPYPGSIGGNVGGSIDINYRFDREQTFRVELCHVHSYVTGSGKNRSRHNKVIWQDTQYLKAERTAKGVTLRFCFDVPTGMRESQESSDNYYKWQIKANARIKGVDLDRTFEIPVFKTAEQSKTRPVIEVNKVSTNEYEAVPYTFNQSGTSYEYFFPSDRMLPLNGILSFIGLLFFMPGLFMMLGVLTPGMVFIGVFVGVFFVLIGGALCLTGIYGLLHSFRVTVNQSASRVEIEKRLAGFVFKKLTFNMSDVKKLFKKSTASLGSTQFYSVYVQIGRSVNNYARKKQLVGSGFRGVSAAEDYISELEKRLEIG